MNDSDIKASMQKNIFIRFSTSSAWFFISSSIRALMVAIVFSLCRGHISTIMHICITGNKIMRMCITSSFETSFCGAGCSVERGRNRLIDFRTCLFRGTFGSTTRGWSLCSHFRYRSLISMFARSFIAVSISESLSTTPFRE